MDNYNNRYDGYDNDYERQNYQADNYAQNTGQYRQNVSDQGMDPRQREYSGNYAGRYTGQLTGQIPRLDAQDFSEQDYNPLDYYKGEGPTVDPRMQRSRERGPERPVHHAQRRPAPGHPQRRGGGRRQQPGRSPYYAQRGRGGTDFALVFGNLLTEFSELFKRLFSARPENAFKTRLSLLSSLVLIFISIILSALYNLANWHSVFAGAKSVLDALGGSAVSDALVGGSAGAWKVFGVGILVHCLNMILIFALLYAFMQLLQSEYRPPQLSLNLLAVATVPYSLVLILLSLTGLLIKPLHFYLPSLAMIFFYLNLYIGFNELNQDKRKSVYWLFLIFMIFSSLLVNYLPTVFNI